MSLRSCSNDKDVVASIQLTNKLKVYPLVLFVKKYCLYVLRDDSILFHPFNLTDLVRD